MSARFIRLALAICIVALPSCAASPRRASSEAQPTTAAATGGEQTQPQSGDAREAANADGDMEMCGAPAMAPAMYEEEDDYGGETAEDRVDAYEDEIDDVDDRLGEALSDRSCGTARRLRDQICELAERICRIADGHEDDDLDDECEDAEDTCREAIADVNDRCPHR